MKYILLAVIVAMLTIASSTVHAQQIPGEAVPSKYLSITSHTVNQNSDGDVNIVGTVENNLDKEVIGIWVVTEYYDKNNNFITLGATIPSAINFPPGESTGFSFLHLLEDSDIVDHYRILVGGQIL
jgi:hypothetical protein